MGERYQTESDRMGSAASSIIGLANGINVAGINLSSRAS